MIYLGVGAVICIGRSGDISRQGQLLVLQYLRH